MEASLSPIGRPGLACLLTAIDSLRPCMHVQLHSNYELQNVDIMGGFLLLPDTILDNPHVTSPWEAVGGNDAHHLPGRHASLMTRNLTSCRAAIDTVVELCMGLL
jgi:hypothetical protein